MPVGTPFQPGQSGNPAGKKAGTISLKTHLKNILATELKNEPDPLQDGVTRDMTAGEKMVLNWVVKALVDGDISGQVYCRDVRGETRPGCEPRRTGRR